MKEDNGRTILITGDCPFVERSRNVRRRIPEKVWGVAWNL